jgi:hypothetical protein
MSAYCPRPKTSDQLDISAFACWLARAQTITNSPTVLVVKPLAEASSFIAALLTRSGNDTKNCRRVLL